MSDETTRWVPDRPASLGRITRAKPKILVVEDMDVVLETYLRTLRSAAYDVVCAASRADALVALAEHRDFDAALLDYA